jgi:hypothetical protein
MDKELIGAELDAAVARALGMPAQIYEDGNCYAMQHGGCRHFDPSTDWSQGGPIIEREWMTIYPMDGNDHWRALVGSSYGDGPTPLVAAMRAFVMSKE